MVPALSVRIPSVCSMRITSDVDRSVNAIDVVLPALVAEIVSVEMEAEGVMIASRTVAALPGIMIDSVALVPDVDSMRGEMSSQNGTP